MSNLRILVASLLLACLASQTAAAARPNIVYIMADELGYYEPSYMGNKNIKTPRIDAIARGGIIFTQGLAGSAVCAPTRCCLMTGKHSGHTSVRTNGGGTPMRKGEVTIATTLKKAGYATGGFGKWGCGGRGSTGVPEQHGFNQFVGYYDQVHAHSYFPKYIIENSKELKLPGNIGGRKGKTYSHYVIMKKATEFIRKNKDKPFFCYLPITPPHGMFDIPDSDPAWKLYKDKPWPEDAKRYAAMVSMVDRNVGEVLDLLKDLKLDKNTFVIFCGDNGGNDYFRSKDHPRGFHGANVHPKTGVEFRGTKGTLYEGGLRIPMVAYWPGRIKPGQTSHLLWYFPDVFPTIAELTGTKPPKDIDGISIVPTLLGEKAAGRKQKLHNYLYWELNGQVALRQKNWKIVKPRRSRTWELYDLSKDISEKNNVAGKFPDRLAKLKKLAEQAHTPAVEGVFHDRANHEKDRLAKWGDVKPPKRRRKKNRRGKLNKLKAAGLLPRSDWKIVRASSQAGRRLAKHAIDGNPSTHWHTQFSPQLKKHPHELVIDLGKKRTINGFRYLARQDGGWNGAILACEISVSDSSDKFGKPAVTAKFKKTRQSQEVKCDTLTGRYVKLRILSEVNGGPWASIAEFGVIGK